MLQPTTSENTEENGMNLLFVNRWFSWISFVDITDVLYEYIILGIDRFGSVASLFDCWRPNIIEVGLFGPKRGLWCHYRFL